MKMRRLLLLLCLALPCWAQTQVNFISAPITMTATSQTSSAIQLTSSYSAGVIQLTGTSLTTATFAVYGCSLTSCTSAQYLPLSTQSCSGIGTWASTQTATANGCYQVNLAGLTSIEYVTSGTFTATSITLTLTASPNAQISHGGGASGTGTVTSFSITGGSPLFACTVANPTTTPAVTCTVSNAAQNSVLAGPASGGAGAPSYQTAPTFSAANLTNFPTFNQNTTGNAATVTTISSLLAAGTNVTVTGSGTSGSPYTIAASGGGSAATAYTPTSLFAFGTSITGCDYLTQYGSVQPNSPQCAANIVAGFLTIPTITPEFVNYGNAGDDVADTFNKVLNNYIPTVGQTQPLTWIEPSTNSAQSNGTAYAATFEQTYLGLASWMVTPIKFAGSTGTPSVGGGCTNNTLYPTGLTGESCTANGATVTYTFTGTGGALFVWPYATNGDAGTYMLTLNGGSPVSGTTAPPVAFAGPNNPTYSGASVVFASTVNGSNTLVLTKTNSSGNAGIIGFGQQGTGPLATQPYVVTVDTFPQSAYANNTVVTAYRGYMATENAILTGYGLPLYPCLTENYIDASTGAAMYANLLHLNAKGHAQFAACVQEAVPGLRPGFYGPFTPGYVGVTAPTGLPGDQTYFVNGNGGTFTMTSQAVGTHADVINYGSGSTTIVSGGTANGYVIAAGTGVILDSAGGSGTGNWFLPLPSSAPFFPANTTNTPGAGSQIVALTGAATIASQSTGTEYLLYNDSSSRAPLNSVDVGTIYLAPFTGATLAFDSGARTISTGSSYDMGSATITPTSGATATCATANCTNLRGSLTIGGGTVTTGTVVALSWAATPSAYVCTATQNGGAAVFGIGNSVATTTGMNITAAVSVLSASLTVNYSCTQ